MSKVEKIETQKKLKTGNGKLGITLLSVGIALVLIFCITVNAITISRFDNVLRQFFGSSPSSTRGDLLGADVNYVKSDFNNAAELYAYEEKLNAEIAQDGSTLLKNTGLLPLSSGQKLDLYGHSSVNLVSGGSGSGSGSFELTLNLKTGLENSGFVVNQQLWDFYSNGAGKGYGLGAGVINYGRGFDWEINECPRSVIEANSSVMNNISRDNVAMFVISRTGGEGGDEPRDMREFGGNADEHYLELNTAERGIVDFIAERYDDIIILVNSNNAFELDWVNKLTNKNIAVINFPGAGRTGTNGLGYMLRGKDADGNEISPSGHLVDTLVADNFSSPAMQNFGDAAFTDANEKVLMYWGNNVMLSDGQYGNKANNINEDAGRCPFYFVTYNEGIYVGYKYYETRYEDVVLKRANVGNFKYDEAVIYPFGFGLSYTSFTWSNFLFSQPNENGDITVSVKVTNTGTRAGKEVVQLYYQAPYTQENITKHIEKAAVNLGGFKKTALLAPNASETVNFNLNVKEFAYFDDSTNGGYRLDDGDYFITVAGDAHTAVNNILKKKAELGVVSIDTDKIVETADIVKASVPLSSEGFVFSPNISASLVKPVEALFADASIIDKSDYLSRSEWNKMDNNGLRYAKLDKQETVECPGVGKNPWGNTHIAACAELNRKQFRAKIPDGLLEKLTSRSSLIPDDKKLNNTFTPTVGVKNGIDLIDLRGKSFDDPLWDDLLNQLTIDELSKMVAQSGYCTPEMKSINKPLVSDLDGPAGLNKVVGHGSAPISKDLVAMTWATEYMLASTWDEELALKMGEAVGEDGLYAGVTGWYGPAMNIHRTPFSGRNFEYYSEDAYISGIMGKNAVQGAARKGMYGFIKHFAVNDQETHRDQNGLITFLNEQSLREIYLKPFELAIKDNDVTVNYNEPIVNNNGKITGYELKTAQIPAATAIMSSFNRIGATWAGGNYKLLTTVLRGEFGFRGFVLTDYDTGEYMTANTKQMLEAGGDAKLNTIGQWNGLTSGAYKNENIRYAKQAAKNVLYAVVNSAAMNGFVHGVRYVAGFSYYKLILIGLDVLGGAGIAVMTLFIVKKVRRIKKSKTGDTVESK